MIRVKLHTGDYLEAIAIYDNRVLVVKKNNTKFVERKEILEWYGGCSKQLPELAVKPYKLTK